MSSFLKLEREGETWGPWGAAKLRIVHMVNIKPNEPWSGTGIIMGICLKNRPLKSIWDGQYSPANDVCRIVYVLQQRHTKGKKTKRHLLIEIYCAKAREMVYKSPEAYRKYLYHQEQSYRNNKKSIIKLLNFKNK